MIPLLPPVCLFMCKREREIESVCACLRRGGGQGQEVLPLPPVCVFSVCVCVIECVMSALLNVSTSFAASSDHLTHTHSLLQPSHTHTHTLIGPPFAVVGFFAPFTSFAASASGAAGGGAGRGTTASSSTSW